MGNISKIARLVKLFYTRKVVTLDEIITLCDVNRRTAYRYLNEMSEANIPLYYDNNVMGYKINLNNYKLNRNLPLSDMALIVYSLKDVASEINDDYLTDFNKIIKELLITNSGNQYNIDRIIEVYDKNKMVSDDSSVRLTNYLVKLAVNLNKSLKVYNGNGDYQKIHDPALIFDKDWHIVDAKVETQKPIKIKNINKIQIV